MPSNAISLKTAFTIAEAKQISRDQFAADLLIAIQEGFIRAISGEFIKASLAFYFAEDSVGDVMRRLSSDYPGAELVAFKGKSEGIWHVPVYETYYTLRIKAKRVEVFSDGKYNEKFPGDEINMAFIERAWMDIAKYRILCDDIDNLSRRIYEKNTLLRVDFERFMGRPTSEPKRRGPKAKYLRQDIIEKAKQLLRDSPEISREQFDNQVMEWLRPLVPKPTQYHKYYGSLWTANQPKRRRIGN